MYAARPLQNLIGQDGSTGRQQVRGPHYFLCYLLHVILVAIHFVLLAVACYHPEHRVIISTPSEVFTIGLSGGLQAFYTLYTTLLAFLTQRLVLSNAFAGPTKLTQIHDICGAWCGLGAALSTLWQQTRLASSTYSVTLVTVYFIGISVLHVASPTIIQFQPFNVTTTSTVSAVSTWPNPIHEFTSSPWDTVALSLAPYMQIMFGDTTPGLVNNILYDIPVSSFVNATVNATILNAHCGLLTNLSFDNSTGEFDVKALMTGLVPPSLTFSLDGYPPLPNEVWFTTPNEASYSDEAFISFLISAEVEADESVSGTNYVYINGTFSPPGNVARNFSTKAYLVGCTFDTAAATATLRSQSVLVQNEQPTSATWPIFSPGGDGDFTRSIMSAIFFGTESLPLSPNCLPVVSEPYWQNMSTFITYMISSLGIYVSPCDGARGIEQYTDTPNLLSRDKVESVISQIAAQFVWIAGQLGEAEGGFDRQTEDAQITKYVIRWRLNINLLPAISCLCASVTLLFLVVCMLWGRSNQKAAMHAAGPLEIMWFGSRSIALNDHMRSIHNPSVDALRTSSIFKTVLWSQSLCAHVSQNASRSALCATPLSPDLTSHATLTFNNHVYIENIQRDSHIDKPRRTQDALRGRWWCYALHIAPAFLHIVLLFLLVLHPEHHVTIPLETTALTIGLSAIVQSIYTLYSALMVFSLQYLAFLKMISGRQKLTAIHDLSDAWTGIGTAALALWKQRKLPSSPWEVSTVVTYLTSMLVLHIASSSILQWQTFENSLHVGVLQSNFALPDSTVDISTQVQWSEIFLLASSTGQDLNLSTYGLSGNTIYDVPQLPENVAVSEAVVSATTFNMQCGLVPNLTLLSAEYSTTSGADQYQVGFSLNTSSNGTLLARPMWKDLLVRIDGECADCAQTLFYMITTVTDVDESICDCLSLNLNWTYLPSPGTNPQNSTTVTHIAACSVSTSTTLATLDLRERKLIQLPNQSDLSASTSWSVWSPAAATNLNIGMVTALSLSNGESGTASDADWTYISNMDVYLMNLLGLNSTAFYGTSTTQSSANPSVKVTPAQLENVLSQTAARYMWAAGQLGEANGGFDRPVGQSPAIRKVVQYRLNINTIPVVFASGASFVALVAAILILGRKPIESSSSSVSGTSVLECLWLETNSDEIHARLQAIDEPDEHKLREAGMFYIRLGDIKARCLRASPASKLEALEQVTLLDSWEHDDVIDIHGDH